MWELWEQGFAITYKQPCLKSSVNKFKHSYSIISVVLSLKFTVILFEAERHVQAFYLFWEWELKNLNGESFKKNFGGGGGWYLRFIFWNFLVTTSQVVLGRWEKPFFSSKLISQLIFKSYLKIHEFCTDAMICVYSSVI